MNVNVIAIGIETVIEDQWCVHKRTRIHQAASLTNLHLFNIEYEAAVENVESHSTFPTEEQNLVIGDLMGQAHIGGHPLRFVDFRSCNFLPYVTTDVITLDGIDDAFLIDSTSKGEDVIVLKDAK